MRRALLVAIAAGGMAVGGAAYATADVLPGTAAAADGCQVGALPVMMSAAQVADVVLQDAGGGRVRSVRLGEENGAAVYTVSFVAGSSKQTVKVDAFTGEVTPLGTGSGATGGATADPSPSVTSGAQQSSNGEDEEDSDDDGESEDGGPVRSGVSGSK